jgi:2,3-bisphosphoglycerate-independent phosphoglycerate mutase
LGIYAGLKVIDVPGATGYLDTNYRGKAEYALKNLKERDFVYLHVEAPDEASHNGDLKNKIRAIEEFDEKVVITVLSGIKESASYRIAVLPDHYTPLSIMTHSSEPVPFAIYSSNQITEVKASTKGFDEESAKLAGFYLEKGGRFMDLLLSTSK